MDDEFTHNADPLESRILAVPESSSALEEIDVKHQQLLQNQQILYATSLITQNSHTPVKVSNIIVQNAECVRPAVLQTYLDQTIGQATTFEELCSQSDILNMKLISNGLVENCTQTVDSRGVLHYSLKDANFAPSYALPRGSNEAISVLDVVSIVNLQSLKKFTAKTGTNVGNGEGDGYLQFQWRNALGGGERFTFDATKGTKTHSSYLVDYTQPLSPWWLWDTSVYKNSRALGNAELLLRGLRGSIKSSFEKHSNANHELNFESVWRSTMASTNHSSDTLLAHCGHDVKNSLGHSLFWDSRDKPIFPFSGSFVKVSNELALGKFWKLTFESSKVKSWLSNNFITASGTVKGGYIKNFNPKTQSIHVSDKFQSGGSNDVRSFQLMGLGPKDLHDSIGGDAFVSYGISVFSRLPINRWSDSNFRLHAFFNGGRLINSNGRPADSLMRALSREHSTSTGVGIVFGHPIARFELNFTIPLSAHTSDSVRKGLQYGIGLSFL
ncbi:LANO_0H06128g1_1 [Lachancea nothofagi CBS 11611]|uniref:LANO_0H06128g1_1 n=1 Tax=Lachancea nothofagi CBS 11611 TaxID=1266666 RepID=A0A1G4KLK9_9SACH|nr:LANO_0H06128g1_1 [Lachancea nothofagi CBS 11611]